MTPRQKQAKKSDHFAAFEHTALFTQELRECFHLGGL